MVADRPPSKRACVECGGTMALWRSKRRVHSRGATSVLKWFVWSCMRCHILYIEETTKFNDEGRDDRGDRDEGPA